MASRKKQVPLGLLLSEFIGTALLLVFGLSIVILNFGAGSPVAEVIPSAGLRRLLTGFFFGSTGALIAISPVGKHSGAHINPVVTLAFWWMGKMRAPLVGGYMVAQMAGAVAGTLPLLAWGRMGRSVEWAATVPGAPGAAGTGTALLGETATTFALVVGLFLFLRHHRLRGFTPLLFPFLYAFMVWLEAPFSGTSTNPARSFGPAVVSGIWQGWWVYWVGPVAGAALAVAYYRNSWLCRLEIKMAKLHHFHHDPHGVLNQK
ncbi:MAG: aquaporin [Verrucomicrobia bacterium]|nr:aquaporin [Verrucomicrobiota bacterium]MDE3099258.1 aquaporin [Verrucomicrobiota bacterium]